MSWGGEKPVRRVSRVDYGSERSRRERNINWRKLKLKHPLLIISLALALWRAGFEKNNVLCMTRSAALDDDDYDGFCREHFCWIRTNGFSTVRGEANNVSAPTSAQRNCIHRGADNSTLMVRVCNGSLMAHNRVWNISAKCLESAVMTRKSKAGRQAIENPWNFTNLIHIKVHEVFTSNGNSAPCAMFWFHLRDSHHNHDTHIRH